MHPFPLRSFVHLLNPRSIEGTVHYYWGETTWSFSKTYLNRGSRPSQGHVSHIAWEAEGKGMRTGVGGVWGVWEMVTSDVHYELQRGGVFRLVPQVVNPTQVPASVPATTAGSPAAAVAVEAGATVTLALP